MTQRPDHAKNCASKARGAYDSARSAYGLGRSQLRIVSVFDDSVVVVIGFFTSLVYSRVSGLAPQHHQTNLALLVAALTVLVFVAIRLCFDWLCYQLWLVNRPWCTLVMRLAQFVRTALLFLLTHFLSNLLLLWWTERKMSTFEVLSAIYVVLLAVYYVLDLLR